MKYKATVLSYLAVRRAVGLVGAFLPIVLFIYAKVFGFGMQPSISEFYHTHMGDIFVGCLVAIGVFLISYRGYPREPDELLSDRWVSTIAGLSILVVAVFPAKPFDPATCNPGQRFPEASDLLCPVQGIYAHWAWLEWLHFAAAAVFFACLAIFSLCLFPKGAVKENGRPNWSNSENKVYLGSGLIIVASLVAILIYAIAGSETKATLRVYNYIFWWEAAATMAFAVAWLTKGKILKALSG